MKRLQQSINVALNIFTPPRPVRGSQSKYF